jgi:ribosomal-protein-alanine N-acetyltransferase
VTQQVNISRKRTDEIARFINDQLPNNELPAIKSAIGSAMKKSNSFGGILMTYYDEQDSLVGAMVVNKTGMKEFFPENILSYIAIHTDFRRLGLGTLMLDDAVKICKGKIFVQLPDVDSSLSFFKKHGFRKDTVGLVRTKKVQLFHSN